MGGSCFMMQGSFSYDNGISIVGTKSIVLQWEEEIKQLVCGIPIQLTYIVHHGNDRGRKHSLAVLGKANIVITTYGIITAEYEQTQGMRLIYMYMYFAFNNSRSDEAHEIRNVRTKKAKAAFSLHALYRWCLTGTPIQNAVLDLHSLFQFVGVEDFSDESWFKKNIALPISKGGPEALTAQWLLKV
ncbi:hypothetical protein GYMLUDRAFT_62536 [Collybiopsis luxurians FD-317 M1]|uniref:Helicase ATP-binding domain-containing protein n=1 Tax=Collybiopsis luxurians FD-317 M1 TaxID=944289 RepID=A0A0D0BZM2_9AGAR|nr:hypothetical protein GYMLUDRAFT_62536 [Collybiopsis luxurians FD-317 M1]